MNNEKQNPLIFIARIINATPDMIFVKDRELRTILCNQAYAGAVGKAPEQMYGHTDIENGWNPELVYGDPGKGIRGFEGDDKDALSGKTVHNTNDPANVGGKIRIFDTMKVPLLDENKDIIGIIGLARDITGQKKIEWQLGESRDYFRNIMNAIGDPVFVKDEQFRFVDVNDALCKILGKARQELIGKTGIEFLPKAEMDHFLEIDRNVLSSGEENLCEENLTAAGGKVNTIVTRKTRYISPVGKKFIVGVIRDITEIKKAEALRKSEEQFRILYEEAPISYQSLDEAGTYLYVNNMWLTTMGYAKEEVIGKKFDDFLAGNWIESFRESFQRFKDEVQISGVQLEIRKKGGSAILIELAGKIAHDDQGNFKQAQCVFQDITKRKIMEKEISNKVLDLERFAAVTVDRELKMEEIEKRIKHLEAMIDAKKGLANFGK